MEKSARFEKSLVCQHLQWEFTIRRNIFTSSSVGALQGAVCQSFFTMKLTPRTQLFYLGDWQTSCLGSSARLILQEVEVTVQFHFLRRILEDLWCNCVRSATSDLQRDSSLPKTWIILSLRTVGICFYYLFENYKRKRKL